MDTMEYGGTAEFEQEVTFRLGRDSDKAHVFSTWPAWSRKLERLFGSPQRVTRKGDKVVSAFWTVPIEAVRVVSGKRITRTLTESQRAAAATRLQTARSSRQAPSSLENLATDQ